MNRAPTTVLMIVMANLALAAGVAHSQVTTILANGVESPYLSSGTVFNDQRTLKGVGVEIEAGPDYEFTSFRVVLEHMSLSPEATGHIYQHDGTVVPGSLLQTLNTQTVSTGTGVYDFTSPVSFTLEAGERY